MDVVAQSRVWNWVIDVVAWCGHYKPNATNLQNDFVVEREQHYWVQPAFGRRGDLRRDKTVRQVADS
jgi:hypothetical protein